MCVCSQHRQGFTNFFLFRAATGHWYTKGWLSTATRLTPAKARCNGGCNHFQMTERNVCKRGVGLGIRGRRRGSISTLWRELFGLDAGESLHQAVWLSSVWYSKPTGDCTITWWVRYALDCYSHACNLGSRGVTMQFFTIHILFQCFNIFEEWYLAHIKRYNTIWFND